MNWSTLNQVILSPMSLANFGYLVYSFFDFTYFCDFLKVKLSSCLLIILLILFLKIPSCTSDPPEIFLSFFLFFFLRKIVTELTSMPLFLYFMWDAATVWLDEQCKVHVWDPNLWTPGHWSGVMNPATMPLGQHLFQQYF